MAGVKKKKKVIVAMSGGIDSSAVAALLKKAGFDVVGIFMKLWPGRAEDEKRARSVAKKLDIPFYALDFRKEFKKKVVDCFLKAHKIGLTPNPCVVCNKEIKFGLLFRKLKTLKADYIATGHYARLRRTKSGCKLLKGRDRNKDQSYFLWRLNQKLLNHTLFPVGGYTKTEVRNLTEKFELPVVDVSESQEICFIKGGDYRDFLKKHLKKNFKEGKVVDTKGKVIGYHLGLSLYTIGQRHGFTINKAQTPNLPPFYVVAKNQKDNQLVVGFGKETERKGFLLRNVNWINPAEFKKGIFKIKLRIRYQGELLEAEIKKNNKEDNLLVSLEEPERGIASGQSVVFYNKDEVLGGGIIDIDKMDKRCLNNSSMT